jgi:hypothetical protein
MLGLGPMQKIAPNNKFSLHTAMQHTVAALLFVARDANASHASVFVMGKCLLLLSLFMSDEYHAAYHTQCNIVCS